MPIFTVVLAVVVAGALGSAVGHGTTAPAAPLGANILANPSFEVDANADNCPDEWTCTAGGTNARATLDSTVAVHGRQSLRITAPRRTDRFLLQRLKRSAAKTTTFRFTTYYRAEQATPVGGFLRATLHDSTGTAYATKTAYGPGGTTNGWTPITLDAPSDGKTVYLSLEFGVTNMTGTVWFDDTFGEAYGSFHFWGGSQLARGPDTDTLTLQLSSHAGLAIDRINLFGTVLTFRDCTTMANSSGGMARLTFSGAWTCDVNARRISLAADRARQGTLTVSGIRVSPPDGEPIVPVLVHEATLGDDQAVWVMARNYGPPDYAAARAAQSWTNTLAVLERLSGYLDTLRTSDNKTWLLQHPKFSGAQPDPHGISSIVRGYLRLYQVTGRDDYRQRAVAGLDWLVERQSKAGAPGGAGSWGLPWAWRHINHDGHYLNGQDHAAHHGYAINTTNVANALLAGYSLFGKREWLDAALRAKDYLLRGSYGFKWLDGGRTYGSVSYCNDRPINSAGDLATEVYNIDGASLAFFATMYQITQEPELVQKGDAIARNLLRRMDPDGGIDYAKFSPNNKPVGYAGIVYSGLHAWGKFRGDQNLVEAARRGLTWAAGVNRPLEITSGGYADTYGLDTTQRIVGSLERYAATQRADGSYSDSAHRDGRSDAAAFATQSAMLVQIGYSTGTLPPPVDELAAPEPLTALDHGP